METRPSPRADARGGSRDRLRYGSLTDERGGLSESKTPGVLDRTGWSLWDGTKFLGGGCHFDGI